MKPAGHLHIEEVRLLPGQEWSNDEAAWHFVLVSSGAAYWLDSVKPRAFTEGELVVSGPLVKSVIRASQLSEVVLHWFGFTPELFCGLFTVAERHLFETNSASSGQALQFLPSTHPVTQRFVHLVSRRAQNGLAARVEVLALVAAFFGESPAEDSAPASLGTNAHNRFEQIISQMPELELIHHTPEQLARLCGCSPRHFNRLFHEHFGESPRARQTELRLLKARQLLGDTDQKIMQIALDSGYRSLSLFNSLFRRRFGVSPSEWRQKSTGTQRKESQSAQDGKPHS